MRKSDVLFLQSVLGALIAVNLKNSLRQLADPYYLWKKSKLDCVGIGGPLGTPPGPWFPPPTPQPRQLFLSRIPLLCGSLVAEPAAKSPGFGVRHPVFTPYLSCSLALCLALNQQVP